MRGADKIIKLRMSGRKPSVIHLWDYPVTGELELEEVLVHKIPTDKLDLRFVMDCLVAITSEDRNIELEALCYANDAKQVVSGPRCKY